jgi:hypothetical protein
MTLLDKNVNNGACIELVIGEKEKHRLGTAVCYLFGANRFESC